MLKKSKDLKSNNLLENFSAPVCLIFCTACFGDVLLCNSLCQNIKLINKNAKIIMIVDKPFFDVAKYQKDIDDVVVYDKKVAHKGLRGLIKFVKEFPYKNPDFSFSIYGNKRNTLIARLIGCKNILYKNKPNSVKVQQEHANFLETVTQKEIQNLPIRYNCPNEISAEMQEQLGNQPYIVLNTISKKDSKDLPVEIAVDVIKQLNRTSDLNVVFCGVGDKSENYVRDLIANGCKLINLVNKTSILELASVIKNGEALISVDTGSMHLGYALQTPTVCVFFDNNFTQFWAPDESIYNVKVLSENISAQSILEGLQSILKENVCE